MKGFIPSGFLACVVISTGVCRAQAQPQTAAPVFEVAAIRAASFPTPDTFRSGQFRLGSRIDGASLDFNFISLADLLPYAFRLKSFQIAGPSWMRESRWNIQAKLPDGASQDQVPEMMQALLAERFKLSIHHEKREEPVYELIAGKAPLKLEPSEPGADADSGASASSLPGPFPGLQFPGPPPGPVSGANSDGRGGLAGRGGFIAGGGTARISPGANCGMHMEFTKLTMPAFADTLTPFLDHPVIDSTGLKGSYKLTLDLPMEVMFGMMQNMARNSGMPFGPGGRGPDGPGGRGPDDPGGRGFDGPGRGFAGCPNPGAALANGGLDTSNTAIFQAIQQLGLKLQPRKAPFDTIIVDHLEKTPTEN